LKRRQRISLTTLPALLVLIVSTLIGAVAPAHADDWGPGARLPASPGHPTADPGAGHAHAPRRAHGWVPPACRYLYDQLTNRGPGPGPGVDEEMEAVLRDREEIQRAAHDAYERARRRET
jgi:hypothetical protein